MTRIPNQTSFDTPILGLPETQVQQSPQIDTTSQIANHSVSFTVPKISYVPLSDDDDSAVFTTSAMLPRDFSDDSSGSSNS
jgi:hypothetical protein